MSGPFTMAPAPAEDDSVFNDPQLTMAIVSILVQKLGGTATITQHDLDQIAFSSLREQQLDSALRLDVQRSHGGTA